MEKKTIGVIGGLGPEASVYLTELITNMVDAKRDQNHPRFIHYSIPDTPDRTAYILGDHSPDKEKDDPFPYLLEAAKTLERAGADFLVIPCVTAQYFYERLREHVGISILPLCADVAGSVERRGIKRVAVFATDGTNECGILAKSFEDKGIEVIMPDASSQAAVMSLIYDNVKTGDINTKDGCLRAVHELDRLTGRMLDEGAEVVILGCTELSLIHRRAYVIGSEYMDRYVDILEILAGCAVRMSGAPVKKAWSAF